MEQSIFSRKRRNSQTIMNMHSKQSIDFIQQLSTSSQSYKPLMNHYIKHQDLEKCLFKQKQYEAMAKLLDIFKLSFIQHSQLLQHTQDKFYNIQQCNEDRIRKRKAIQQQLDGIKENNERLKSRLLSIKQQHLANKNVKPLQKQQQIKEEDDEDFGSIVIPEPSRLSMSTLRSKSQQNKQGKYIKHDFLTQKKIHEQSETAIDLRRKKSNSMRQTSDFNCKNNQMPDKKQLLAQTFEGPNLQELVGKKLQSNMKHKEKRHQLIDRFRNHRRPQEIASNIQDLTIDYGSNATIKDKPLARLNPFFPEDDLHKKQHTKDHDDTLVKLNPNILITKVNIFRNEDEDSEEEERIIREDLEFMTKFNQKCNNYKR